MTPAQLMAGTNCNGDRAARWAGPLTEAARFFGIDSAEQRAMFLAQCAHESMRFRRVIEDLDYSAARIVEVWPKRFNAATAHKYAGRPEMLANFVYASRMGNGKAETGDGWRFRGRGLIQITGRDNYRAAGTALGLPLEAEPALASMTDNAARIAAWFFAQRARCLDDAAAGNVREVTKRINGGVVGLDDRTALYNSCLRALRS